MREVDIAWAAGFIDGEGCIQISKSKDKKDKDRLQFSLRVTVVQVDTRPLEFLQSLFGGHIHDDSSRLKKERAKEGKWRPCKKWAIHGLDAYAFLVLIRPYLKTKKEQADLVLNEWTFFGQGRRKMSEDLISSRTKVWQQLKTLKRAA